MPGVFPQLSLSLRQHLGTTALEPGSMPGAFCWEPVLRDRGREARPTAVTPVRSGKENLRSKDGNTGF